MTDDLKTFRLVGNIMAGVSVALKRWGKRQGATIITPPCVTPGELDIWADRLIAELTTLKRNFRTHYESQRRMTDHDDPDPTTG